MLKIYSVSWCPHCRKAVKYLMSQHIDFTYIDVEHQSEEGVKPVDDANGGSWRVPTLEHDGKWKKARPFSEKTFEADLKDLGVI